MADRGYFALLSHLYHPDITLTLPIVQASIAHYLSHLPQPPTSLSASIISSPLFQPFSYAKLEALCTAHRHAVQSKVKLLQEDKGGVFSRGLHPRLREWTKGVLEGFRGGHAVLKLVCCGGLLLGLEDLEGELHLGNGGERGMVEEEIVLALAEVLDTYSYVPYSTEWAKDFKSESEDGEEPLALSLLLASRFVPLISTARLETLPLPVFSDLLTSTIESAFQGGKYLTHASSSSQGASLAFDASSPFATTIRALSSSKYILSMATLSKFSARILSVLAESRPSYGWPAMAQALIRLQRTAGAVEAGWVSSSFASVSNEEDVAPDSRELVTQTWNLLKTQLFTTIMLCQAILSTVVFVPHPGTEPSTSTSSPQSLATAVLRTLSHLSFVVHQFGGVTASSGGGFPELKRVFYMALDVLASDPGESERFVAELCQPSSANVHVPAFVKNVKTAYVLACIEQLTPVLSDECILRDVFWLCLPLLSDVTHRETYESAHSVMLAVFSAYAQKTTQHASTHAGAESSSFISQIIPFYTECLLENSSDGKLNTAQLCLAYAAVVRGATACGDGEVLACFCVDKLLDALHQVGDLNGPSNEHLHRLHLTLVATVSSISSALLPRVLDECKAVISSLSDSSAATQRRELTQALFREISENVGDAEKEYCMRWWYDNRASFVVDAGASEMWWRALEVQRDCKIRRYGEIALHSRMRPEGRRSYGD
ncbi:uncharacterized protein B0H18DRAFT_1100836 [Fomitopsis serialis]|uniref:uncharacterized protein n=1 Tax=Fomitopsis serialis TaxID=139415 RepID=UPI002007D22B|nr:uncharacterized protein B0H18DRAFT_1100836 [Neoantrodia serialis]KAH9936123.1 hypothetical protein B0H18DRAFT_1100836 [Neoantrodia serialis]